MNECPGTVPKNDSLFFSTVSQYSEFVMVRESRNAAARTLGKTPQRLAREQGSQSKSRFLQRHGGDVETKWIFEIAHIQGETLGPAIGRELRD